MVQRRKLHKGIIDDSLPGFSGEVFVVGQVCRTHWLEPFAGGIFTE